MKSRYERACEKLAMAKDALRRHRDDDYLQINHPFAFSYGIAWYTKRIKMWEKCIKHLEQKG